MPSATLLISEPCPASWAAMTPAAGGRHCAACATTVVDFTLKTDAELLAFFRQAGAGRTCGRFRAGQLGRPLRPARLVARPPHWQLWLAGLLVATLSVKSCQPTTGEVQPTTSRRLPPPPPSEASVFDTTTMGDSKTLVGDSIVVSAAPDSSGQLVHMVLGAPAMQ